jgi:hypothetical protein
MCYSKKLIFDTYCAFLLFILITQLQTSKDHCFAKSANRLRLDHKLRFNVAAGVQRIETTGWLLLKMRQLFLLLVFIFLAMLLLEDSVCSLAQSWHGSAES